MIHVAIAGTPEGAANFIASLHALDAEGKDVLQETDFSGYDALILPGGADIDPALFGEEVCGSRKIEPERDRRQIEILRHFLDAGKPILGVCKGHQLLNVALGGKICQNIPEFEVHQWIEHDQAHGSHCLSDCFLAELYGTDFPINSAHHQAILEPVPGFRAIQWAPDGVLEAMVHEEKPIIGLQWHPERMCLVHRREDTVDGLPIFEYFLKVIRGEAKVY